MSRVTENSCDEFRRAEGLARRTLLKGMAATGAALTVNAAFGGAFRQAAFATTPVDNVLVVLSLRGGIDGLGMVVPHGDPFYYEARPKLALPASSLICADPMFGLHPELAPLSWLWSSGEMAAVHAVGMITPTRSHFAAMELIEEADPGSTARNGWVNRMVGLNTTQSPVEAIQMGTSYPSTLITGDAPTLAARHLRDLQLTDLNGTNMWADRRRRQLELSWGSATGPFARPGAEAIAISDAAAALSSLPPSTVRYPSEVAGKDLGEALADSAQLIRADIGVEVITIDHGTWDMHSGYGTPDVGRMHDMMRGLAKALDAFMRDLGDLRSRVTVVTTSEFGRRVAENGNGGLDHGWGNVMLLLGAHVRGGQFRGTWPGLGAGKTVDGDLAVTTDYRNVFAEVISRAFPDRSLANVFPGLSYAPLGLTRPG